MKTIDWSLGNAARGFGEQFKSLETTLVEKFWPYNVNCLLIISIANEENQ